MTERARASSGKAAARAKGALVRDVGPAPTPRDEPKRGRRADSATPIKFDRRFAQFDIARLVRSAGTRNYAEFARRNRLLSRLAEAARGDTLRAFHRGEISIEELVRADEAGVLLAPFTEHSLRRSLWDAAPALITRCAKEHASRARYYTALISLGPNPPLIAPPKQDGRPGDIPVKKRERPTLDVLGPGATIADLGEVDWWAVHRTHQDLGKSAADWNHIRRTISVILSKAAGKKSPLRMRVMAAENFPLADEVERTTSLPPRTLERVVERLTPKVRAAIMSIVITGMRRGEYLLCRQANLDTASHILNVPVNASSAATVPGPVHESLWHWIEDGVPAPLQYKALMRHWKKACITEGALHNGKPLWLHDLRHAFAQYLSDLGVPEEAIQTMLRQRTPNLVRRYTKQTRNRNAADKLGGALAKVGVKKSAGRREKTHPLVQAVLDDPAALEALRAALRRI
jgi:integrase